MSVSADLVKRLRDMTGAGMMDSKRALQETGGDVEKARVLLRERGQAAAAKRAGRAASEGRVEAYIHGDGRVGVLIEVNSESDFVANTDEFRALARELAIQVAGHSPQWVSEDDVPEEELAQERKIYETQAREEGKPDAVIPKIVEGKLNAFLKERCLLDQPFFRDLSGKQTVGERIAEEKARLGENIVVRRFVRFERGKDDAGG
ncbi:MAG TPA: translation elongation factor Ts [Actinomycetota bacterium]|nr:translation elongation factor Ts [Actinomycetota bacterium]